LGLLAGTFKSAALSDRHSGSTWRSPLILEAQIKTEPLVDDKGWALGGS
jgi:hypothetical protein